jgi:MFS family permease
MRSNWILFLSNASAMMSMIFIPLFADLVGASRFDIGVIGASYGIAIFFSSYFFSRASDRQDKRVFLKAGLGVAAVAFFLQVFAESALSLTIVRGVAGFAMGIFTAPLIVYTYESGGKLGMFSSYGALGWAAGGMFAGITGQLAESYIGASSLAPYWAVFALSSVLFLAAFLLSFDMPEVKVRPTQVPLFPAALIKKNLWVYASVLMRNTGAFAIWTILPLFLLELGANMFWIGGLFFINTGTQFIIMRRLDIRNDETLIKAGLALSGVVFFSYSLAPVFYVIAPFQILLAFSYSFMYVGSLLFLTRTNEEKTTSVGILNSVLSLSMVIGPLFGGAIAQIWGFREVMYFAAGITFVGLVIALVLNPKSS